jgi:trehalose-phosphatase
MTQASPFVAQVISEVVKRAQPNRLFSLFLDYDGTLVEIAADPAAPQLSDTTRETLRRISEKRSCITTIISGRAIDDLYSRIRLDGFIYAGNHGLEIRGRGLEFVEPEAAGLRDRLKDISATLTSKLQSIPGAFVEYKGLSASVHFRQVESSHVDRIDAAVREIVARNGASFRLNTGRKVFEIVPRTGWHKGAAARWINQHLRLDERLSIYLGDDSTDEDAFAELTQALTVKVGGSSVTCAKYHLPGPQAVHEFLAWLAGFELSAAVAVPAGESHPLASGDRSG